MRRLGFGLVLVGLVFAAQAAQPDDDFFVPKLDLLTARLVNSDSDYLPPYQLSASVVLSRLPDTVSINKSGFGSTFPLPSIAKPQPGISPATTSHWQPTYLGGHASLSRFFRVEFKVEQLNVALRPHSISVEGEQFKVTFRSSSALIEAERLKIILQPHSVSMLWNKPF